MCVFSLNWREFPFGFDHKPLENGLIEAKLVCKTWLKLRVIAALPRTAETWEYLDQARCKVGSSNGDREINFVLASLAGVLIHLLKLLSTPTSLQLNLKMPRKTVKLLFITQSYLYNFTSCYSRVLAIGELSPPVDTASGIHLILRTNLWSWPSFSSSSFKQKLLD